MTLPPESSCPHPVRTGQLYLASSPGPSRSILSSVSRSRSPPTLLSLSCRLHPPSALATSPFLPPPHAFRPFVQNPAVAPSLPSHLLVAGPLHPPSPPSTRLPAKCSSITPTNATTPFSPRKFPRKILPSRAGTARVPHRFPPARGKFRVPPLSFPFVFPRAIGFACFLVPSSPIRTPHLPIKCDSVHSPKHPFSRGVAPAVGIAHSNPALPLPLPAFTVLLPPSPPSTAASHPHAPRPYSPTTRSISSLTRIISSGSSIDTPAGT